jgi:hypothetical protein
VKSLKIGDRVRSTKWGKAVLKPHPYIGLEGTVTGLHGDHIRVKLDADPIEGAESCPFFPSELELIKEGAAN